MIQPRTAAPPSPQPDDRVRSPVWGSTRTTAPSPGIDHDESARGLDRKGLQEAQTGDHGR